MKSQNPNKECHFRKVVKPFFQWIPALSRVCSFPLIDVKDVAAMNKAIAIGIGPRKPPGLLPTSIHLIRDTNSILDNDKYWDMACQALFIPAPGKTVIFGVKQGNSLVPTELCGYSSFLHLAFLTYFNIQYAPSFKCLLQELLDFSNKNSSLSLCAEYTMPTQLYEQYKI